MATITVNPTYLDGGTARTAGEVMTINGGRLVVRTDTRWHANAPVSLTGSLGSATISSSLGGGYEVDGTQVRWLAISGGSGTAAIGATVTQGGVSGYFLGYWASLNAAPSTTIGATGFIKLREVTGGTFSAGALSGITATADGPDVPGWIEVVHDQAATIAVPRLGDFKVRGDWFSLGTTSGAENQAITLPGLGGVSWGLGLWIETAVADEYEFYPGVDYALMLTANFGTDERSKFVCITGSGTLLIGHNGTTAVGYVPPASRKIRIPNVIMRQCTTAARAANVIPHATIASRPEFSTTSSGAIDIEFAYTDWYLNLLQPYSVRIANSAYADTAYIGECATFVTMQNVGKGCTASIDSRSLQLTSNFSGGAITDCNLPRYLAGSSDHAVDLVYCKGFTLSNVTSGILQYARSSGYAFNVAQSTDIELNDCTAMNSTTAVVTSANVRINDHDHVDRIVGTTITTTALYAVAVSSQSSNIVVDGCTFGLRGLIPDVHPYSGVFNCGASQDVTFRNLGTRSAFVNGGTVNQLGYIYASGGNNTRVRVQRCYLSPARLGVISAVNTDTGCTFQNVSVGGVGVSNAGLNQTLRAVGANVSTSAQSAVYGSHFHDLFVSDTSGRLILMFNEPSVATAPYVTVVSGSPKFTSAGNITMQSVGDEVIFEQSYFAIGHTGFVIGSPTVVGTNVTWTSGAHWGNHDIYFQLDKGAGFDGNWLDCNGVNLAAAGTGIDPAVGMRIKYRIVTVVANATNLLTYFGPLTYTTLAAQTDNLYPLDVTTLTVTGFEPGSDIVVLAAGTDTVLASVDSYAGSSWGYVYETAQPVDVGVLKPGFIPRYVRNYALGSTDASLLITQSFDRNYS